MSPYFDGCYFDPTYFDASVCNPTFAGGKRPRRVPRIPAMKPSGWVIEDDELAGVLL